MPILEAGLLGMPVFSSKIPAAMEIGAGVVTRFSPDNAPDSIAGMLLDWAQNSTTQRLRQRIRQNFTWQAIFQHDILPLISRGKRS
jgi:glycosyltransferase involved in cell wall biosynthesis